MADALVGNLFLQSEFYNQFKRVKDQSSRSKRQTSDNLTLSISEVQGLYPGRFNRNKSSTTVLQVRLRIKARNFTNGPSVLVTASHKRRHKRPEDVQLAVRKEKTSKRLTWLEDLVKLWILGPWIDVRRPTPTFYPDKNKRNVMNCLNPSISDNENLHQRGKEDNIGWKEGAAMEQDGGLFDRAIGQNLESRKRKFSNNSMPSIKISSYPMQTDKTSAILISFFWQEKHVSTMFLPKNDVNKAFQVGQKRFKMKQVTFQKKKKKKEKKKKKWNRNLWMHIHAYQNVSTPFLKKKIKETKKIEVYKLKPKTP
ncbi:hypothetical protein PGT21_033457 [Puccinia graminis f. sp. tritici]|uniref:Uncharacterized protein n=1 Tax=Puccinia graminis f. sp. tritici TaxID=56615 RepID=A0A5B0M7Q1_PUCGR|nr:hypothetical protein PGT21_033457 [Puccinia graminis f. sp. tritici]